MSRVKALAVTRSWKKTQRRLAQLARLSVKFEPSSHFLGFRRLLIWSYPSLNMPDLRVGWESHKNKIKRNPCALGSRNMVSEKGRELKIEGT